MLKGNISNCSSPIVAFNVDHLLFKENAEEFGFFRKILSNFSLDRKEVNAEFISLVNKIWTKYDVAIYLITALDKQLVEELLDENMVSYTSLQNFDNVGDLDYIIEKHYFLYVDNDDNFLSKLHTKKAINISELPKYLP